MQGNHATGGTTGAQSGSGGTDTVMQDGQDTWPQTMDQTFTYEVDPSLQLEITVTVKPARPPTAALVGNPGDRPK